VVGKKEPGMNAILFQNMSSPHTCDEFASFVSFKLFSGEFERFLTASFPTSKELSGERSLIMLVGKFA
jgi:hypothetical protein